MSFSKYTKRRGQFEALEAKQLFAADLVGGAAADLPDTVVVAENISEDDFVINPLNVRTNIGGIKTNMDSETEVIELTHNIENGQIDRRSGSIMSIEDPHETGDAPAIAVAEGNTNSVEDPFYYQITNSLKSKTSEARTNLGGQDDHWDCIGLVAGGEGLYQTNELELAPNLGGQEGEPVTDHIVSDHVWEAGGHPTDGPLYLGGQEGEPFIDNCVPNSFIRPPRSNELELASSLGGQEGEPLMNTNLSDHLVAGGEGLYQTNELELAPNLGGQEGEDVVRHDVDMTEETSIRDVDVAEETSIRDADSELDNFRTGTVLPFDFSPVDQVFEQYSKDETFAVGRVE